MVSITIFRPGASRGARRRRPPVLLAPCDRDTGPADLTENFGVVSVVTSVPVGSIDASEEELEDDDEVEEELDVPVDESDELEDDDATETLSDELSDELELDEESSSSLEASFAWTLVVSPLLASSVTTLDDSTR